MTDCREIDLDKSIGLYVHVPFCETKCSYCDFNTYAGIEYLIPKYVNALSAEIDYWGQVLSRPALSSIFVGGGTPSLFSVAEMMSVIDAIKRSFRILDDPEITIEANPRDICEDKMRGYLAAGINRLSIGMQSFQKDQLKILGRTHSSVEAKEAYFIARKSGFPNINVDVIYGIPNQTLSDWKETLREVLSMNPDHISAYCLSVEKQTPIDAWIREGKLPVPDPDLAADMMLIAEEMLGSRGYDHYEISNWAKPGCASRHNLTYWKNGSYLGVGPGAHSHVGNMRFWNINSPQKYMTNIYQSEKSTAQARQSPTKEFIEKSKIVAGVETIDTKSSLAETLMLGLRLNEGISLDQLRLRFGSKAMSAPLERLELFIDQGLLVAEGDRLSLTQRGRLLGNEVFSSVLVGGDK